MFNTLSEINNNITENTQAFIAECEECFESALNGAVNDFLSNCDFDIVLLAGPSSSGKTTTACKLAEKIKKSGRCAFTVSLDDFYLNRADIAVNEDGLKDFENITALDIELIHTTFAELIKKRKAELPIFDFTTGCRSEKTKHIELDKNDVLIVEGLHALNPLITEGLDESHVYKIYISVSTRVLGDDGKILLNKRNLRLIRRLVRDYKHRNSSVEYTFSMWPGVMKGEDKFLFPFESYANVKIDSFHGYEPCILKQEALKLLHEVSKENPWYDQARDLIEKLELFDSLPIEFLPENSLLSEFLS